MSKQFDSLKHPRIDFASKIMHVSRQSLGVVVGFRSSSSINGSDETLGCESLPLSNVCLIKDGTLRFHHISHEQGAL